MARFDVYATMDGGAPPFVLDVQADVLDRLDTRVVVPLERLAASPRPARGLNPAFEIDGDTYLMLTQYISAIPVSDLTDPILSLDKKSDDIMRALDLLLVGF